MRDTQGLSLDLNYRPNGSQTNEYRLMIDVPSTRPADMSFGLCTSQSTRAADFSVCARKGVASEKQMMLQMQLSR